MIQFPSSTAVGRILPKEAFYRRLTLSSDLKDKFVSDVKRITISNSLTAATLNLEPGTEVSEILILTMELKKQEFDGRIVENIARQNKHQLVFILRYEGSAQLAAYYGKLYKTDWEPINDLRLAAKGFTLDDVWNGFLEQIALRDDGGDHSDDTDLDSRLRRQNEALKLEKEIEKLERLARNENQPKKKFELYQHLQTKQRELEVISYGQKKHF